MDAAKKFKVGDLVWGKMRSYPPWPAAVLDPPKDNKVHVYFFGAKNHAFLPEKDVTRHSRSMLTACKRKKMSSSLQVAVKELEQAAGSNAKKSGKQSLDKQEEYTMRRRPTTLGASLKVQLKVKYQRIKKRKAMQKKCLPCRKDPQPRPPRTIPSNVPYKLRSKVVPEAIPDPVPEPVVEPVPVSSPERLPSRPTVSIPVILPDLKCGMCRDSRKRNATDEKVITPCCKTSMHMSCILYYSRRSLGTHCPICHKDLDVGLRIKMTEDYVITVGYEFQTQSSVGVWY